jgi:uncharacterized protein YukE
MKSLRTSVWIILGVGSLLCLFPIVFYVVNFGQTDISANPENWGVFGDFFGGILNPVISCVNLALLIAISIYVARMDTNRQTNEFRYKAYTELCTKLESTNEDSESLQSLHDFIAQFGTNNQFLFVGEANLAFNHVFQRLQTTLQKLIPLIEEFEEEVNTGKVQVIELSKSDQRRLGKAFEGFPSVSTPKGEADSEYEAAKIGVIAFMQTVMMDADLKPFLPLKTA